MSKKNVAVLMGVLVAVVMTLAPAQAGTIRGYIDGPFVVGDQLFAGGTLQVRPVDGGSLVQVIVDGRPVALMYRPTPPRHTAGTGLDFVLRVDEHGLRHLVGVRYAAPDHAPVVRALSVASVAPGMITVPRSALHLYGDAVASR